MFHQYNIYVCNVFQWFSSHFHAFLPQSSFPSAHIMLSYRCFPSASLHSVLPWHVNLLFQVYLESCFHKYIFLVTPNDTYFSELWVLLSVHFSTKSWTNSFCWKIVLCAYFAFLIQQEAPFGQGAMSYELRLNW